MDGRSDTLCENSDSLIGRGLMGKKDTCAINDPRGQTLSPAILTWNLFLKRDFIKWEREDGRRDVQTTRAKIGITTGRDCESASWIIFIGTLKIETSNLDFHLRWLSVTSGLERSW